MVLVGFQGVQALDLVGPFEVFTGATLCLAGQGRPDDGYEVTIAAVDGQSVSTGHRAGDRGASRCPTRANPSTPSCCPAASAPRRPAATTTLIGWIAAAAPNARRVVSVCTGAFLAAQAGLLDGCRATTHWAFAGQLASEFPAVTVDPEPIFVRSSPKVWTAAGVTAGIDLALSLVEDDYGTEVAQTVARWLVLYLRRPGGQTQFAAPVWMPRAKRAPIRDRAGGHRDRTRWRRTASPISPGARR